MKTFLSSENIRKILAIALDSAERGSVVVGCRQSVETLFLVHIHPEYSYPA